MDEVGDFVALAGDYVATSSSERKAAIAGTMATKVLSREKRMADVVTSLGVQLTDVNADIRSRGLDLLSSVLGRLTTPCLNVQEAEVVVSFYVDRLEDQACIGPCLRGLLAIAAYQRLTGSLPQHMAQGLFSSVRTQALAQGLRGQVYTLLTALLSKYCKELQTLGGDFVLGFIQAVDGEKDPRNLLSVFGLVPVVTANFDCSGFMEDLVEVTSCYFPITFTPPPDDPHKITREDLSSALNKCLASTAGFGQFFVPLLVEKLGSALMETRKEVYLSLAVCAPTYGAQWLGPHVDGLWSGIRTEVFDNTDRPVAQHALKALKAMTAALGPEPGPLTELVRLTLAEGLRCFRTLDDMGDQGKPSALLLTAVAGASGSACLPVLAEGLPVVLGQWGQAKDTLQRHGLLEALVNMLRAANDAVGPAEDGHVSEHPVGSHGASVMAVCGDALQQTSSPGLRTLGLYGLGALVALRVLDADQLVEVAQHVAHVGSLEEDTNVINGLVDIGAGVMQHAPEQMLSHAMLPLLDTLPAAGARTGTVLRVIGALASPLGASQVGADRLMGVLEAQSVDAEWRGSVVSCLGGVVGHMASRQQPGEMQYLAEGVGPRMLGLATRGGLDTERVAGVMKTITQALQTDAQTRLLSQALEASGLQGTGSPQPHCVPVAVAVLGSMQPSVVIPEGLIGRLVDVALGVDTTASLAAAMGLSAMANKAPNDAVWESTLDGLVAAAQAQDGRKKTAVQAYAWVCKGLVMAGSKQQRAAVARLMAWLPTPLGTDAADGIGVLVGDTDAVLTKACHATVRGLYRQRLFSETVGPLREGYAAEGEGSRACYLLALSHLLQHLPKQALLAELPPLMGLLQESLTSALGPLKRATLQTLNGLVGDAPEILAKHTDALLPKLLVLATQDPDMHVRKSALSLLGGMAGLPYVTLHPHKHSVLAAVGRAVGDRKRLVRQEAVVCSNKWAVL